MSKKGKITYEQKDRKGHFRFSYKITNYEAAIILQYIAERKKLEPKIPRNKKGQFKKVKKS